MFNLGLKLHYSLCAAQRVMPKLSIFFPLASLLAACPGQVYDPCVTVDDCDPEVADACVRFPGSGQGICTLICKGDSDCPEGPQGELAVCKPVEPSGIKACSLP